MDVFTGIYRDISSRAVAEQYLKRLCATFLGHCDFTKWAVGRHQIRTLNDLLLTKVVRRGKELINCTCAQKDCGIRFKRPQCTEMGCVDWRGDVWAHAGTRM